jgi:hypothetical protein
MFPGNLIAVAFVTMLMGVSANEFAEKRNWLTTCKLLATIGLAASIYCIAAGLSLFVEWQDPLADASAQTIAHASATGRGKGGIIIIMVRFWPYVLIGLGGMFAVCYAVMALPKFKTSPKIKPSLSR